MTNDSPPAGDDPLASKAGSAYFTARAALHARLEAGVGGMRTAHALADATDALLRALAAPHAANLTPRSGIAMLAQGGYGRREISPGSDIDLVVLYDGDPINREKAEALTRDLQHHLWNAKLTVGAAIRSLDEQRDWMERDHTVLTAALDFRLVLGGTHIATQARTLVVDELNRRGFTGFVEDRMREITRRRARFGGSVFLLEPDVKLGEGGLRDAHEALWLEHVGAELRHPVARYTATDEHARKLRRDFDRAHAHLLSVRHHMHTIAAKRADRLTFDLQEKVARVMNYRDEPRRLGVERFMRDLYRACRIITLYATGIFDLCDPRRSADRRVSFPIDWRFRVHDGCIDVTVPSVFTNDPPSLVEMFQIAAREQRPLSVQTRTLVVQLAARCLRKEMRANARVVEAFLNTLSSVTDDGTTLFDMHRLGVLSRVIPEFARINTMVIHDSYHVYTVDEHTLRVIALAKRLFGERLGPTEAHLTTLARGITHLRPFFLALLLHDVAKLSGKGPHADVGADMSRDVAKRLGFTPEDADETEWLIRNHLLMSHTAQRRDTSDPQLLLDFARQMGSLRRLTLLYLLTFVDISSVGPGMWTDFKARLLNDLYQRVSERLVSKEASAAMTGRRKRRLAAIKGYLARNASAATVANFIRVLPDSYADGLHAREIEHDLHLYEAARTKKTFVVELEERDDEPFTTLVMAGPDQPGLLYKASGVLASFGLNVLSAEINTTRDGIALNRLVVANSEAMTRLKGSARRIEKRLRDVIAETVDLTELLAERRRHQEFAPSGPPVAMGVAIEIPATPPNTVIVEVTAKDRVGLLHDITRALTDFGVSITLAKIETQGQRAVDTFYVEGLGDTTDQRTARAAELRRFLASTLAS